MQFNTAGAAGASRVPAMVASAVSFGRAQACAQQIRQRHDHRSRLRSRQRRTVTEEFDVLDCTGKRTGARISRDDAHAGGVWHGAFHCLIVGERGGRGYTLIQKRALTKKIAPGKFDISVGGHYASGEDAGIAGPREIKEELGLDVQFSDLVPVGRRVFLYCFAPGIQEYEFQDVFLLPRNVGPKDLLLQREELDGVVFLGVEEGIALLSGKIPQITTKILRSAGKEEPAVIVPGDLVPCLDNYYLKMLLLARRYLRGDRELLFI